jgi:hypothetical protein
MTIREEWQLPLTWLGQFIIMEEQSPPLALNVILVLPPKLSRDRCCWFRYILLSGINLRALKKKW